MSKNYIGSLFDLHIGLIRFDFLISLLLLLFLILIMVVLNRYILKQPIIVVDRDAKEDQATKDT